MYIIKIKILKAVRLLTVHNNTHNKPNCDLQSHKCDLLSHSYNLLFCNYYFLAYKFDLPWGFLSLACQTFWQKQTSTLFGWTSTLKTFRTKIPHHIDPNNYIYKKSNKAVLLIDLQHFPQWPNTTRDIKV